MRCQDLNDQRAIPALVCGFDFADRRTLINPLASTPALSLFLSVISYLSIPLFLLFSSLFSLSPPPPPPPPFYLASKTNAKGLTWAQSTAHATLSSFVTIIIQRSNRSRLSLSPELLTTTLTFPAKIYGRFTHK